MTLSNHSRGLAAVLFAYAIWGLFPVYWKAFSAIPPLELTLARLVLTAASCLMLIRLRRTWPAFRLAWRDHPQLQRSLLAALLLAINWLGFIWAVNAGRVMESSLGYFLCPLVSILLGRFIEGEPLNHWQWGATVLASAGVGVMVAVAGRIPMAAVLIALSWGGYGLMKKRYQLGPVTGLGLETTLLAPIAVAGLGVLALVTEPALPRLTCSRLALLSLSGFLTAAPLLLFAYSAQRVRLSTMGMGQYIVPSSHFALAMAYGEPVNTGLLLGFALIWGALALYSLSGRIGAGERKCR